VLDIMEKYGKLYGIMAFISRNGSAIRKPANPVIVLHEVRQVMHTSMSPSCALRITTF